MTTLWLVLHLLWIPVEAVLLHFFGTTPGKWLMGIRVESINGGNLTFSNALRRGWSVLWHGYGFRIRIYKYWRFYQSYKEYEEFGYTQWDYEYGAEFRFTYYYDAKRKAAIAGFLALCLFALGCSVNDSVKPVNRGVDLTVAQFAENYNDLIDARSTSQVLQTEYLRENGKWKANTYGSNIIVVGSKEVGGVSNFEYELEDGYVRQISYLQTWENIFMLSPVSLPKNVIMAVATAQDWMDLWEYYEFEKLLDNEMKVSEGTIRYENLEIHWSVASENCRTSNGTYYADDTDAQSTVSLEFKLIIHDSP